jgi:hypothetical protein
MNPESALTSSSETGIKSSLSGVVRAASVDRRALYSGPVSDAVADPQVEGEIAVLVKENVAADVGAPVSVAHHDVPEVKPFPIHVHVAVDAVAEAEVGQRKRPVAHDHFGVEGWVRPRAGNLRGAGRVAAHVLNLLLEDVLEEEQVGPLDIELQVERRSGRRNVGRVGRGGGR